MFALCRLGYKLLLMSSNKIELMNIMPSVKHRSYIHSYVTNLHSVHVLSRSLCSLANSNLD